MQTLRLKRVLVLLVCAVLTAVCGCATPGQMKFLGDSLGLAKGRYVDQSWSDRVRIQAGGYSAIELARIDTSAILDQKGMTKAEAASLLRESIVESSGSTQVLAFSGAGPKARLELAITEMDPGDALARAFAAELGAGHAYVQVEGRVIDDRTGAFLAAVADRRRGTGVIGLRDTFGSSGPAMVREMIMGAGGDLKRELAQLFQRE